MENQITIRQWIENFDNNKYDSFDRTTQIEAGWFDWFCKDDSLAGKTKRLGSKVKRIAKSSKIDIDKTYLLFKNNCPVCGRLYDDFRIVDIETDDVLYTVVPSSGYDSNRGESEVWGVDNNFKEPIVHGSWRLICKWFGV